LEAYELLYGDESLERFQDMIALPDATIGVADVLSLGKPPFLAVFG
jgi:hypothetical protein